MVGAFAVLVPSKRVRADADAGGGARAWLVAAGVAPERP
jgi:hypothetical protein